MPPDAIPTFDEWVNYCFTQGYGDFYDYGTVQGEAFEGIEARSARFLQMPHHVVAQYAIRLFSNPAPIASTYTDEQIADGIWFTFGCGSEYLRYVRESDVPLELRRRAISSVATMYTDCFDRVCNRHGADPDGFYTNSLRPDMAVGMIWDMDSGIHGAMYCGLEDPGFEVLETALFRCRTASCKGSALHGLGHLVDAYPDRARSMIDRFLTLPNQPEHLREYALEARTGRIL